MKSVLIIEDEALHLEKVKGAFQGYEREFDLHFTDSITRATQVIDNNPPHIILTDNRLPDGQGRELVSAVHHKIPVILMTAYGDERLAAEAMKEGAMDYVVKTPGDIAALPRKIQSTLRAWKLRCEQRRLQIFNREVIDNLSSGLIVYDRNLRYKVWNPFMENITGRSASEVLGKNALEVFPFLKEYGLDEMLKRALKGESVRTPDVPYSVHNTGKSGWVSSYYSPHYDEQGDIIGVIAIVNDITGRKQTEKQLQELNTMKDQLFSIIAHDLKNPISDIMGFSELILHYRDLHDESRTRQFQEQIYEATKNLNELLDSLLAWSRTQGEQGYFHPQPFRLFPAVKDTIKIYKTRALKNHIRIYNQVPQELAVVGDQQMVRTIIRNLLSNALKYTPPGKKIRIGARVSGEKIVVSVNDQGQGIIPEHQITLFRGGNSITTQGLSGEEGSGMGLLLCKDLIDRHGEQIWVESQPGKGSSFMFSLPAWSESDPESI